MKITVNGVTLYYEIVGQGTPLILVHGNGDDHHIFDAAVSVLEKHFTCYLLDSRGHGMSSKVTINNYEEMADDLLGFVDALQLKHPVYSGFSDGGVIGLLAAMKRPDLFAKIIICGANLFPKGVKLWMRLYLKISSLFDKDPLLKLMLEQPNIPPSALKKVNSPTLVVAGSKDLIKESHTRTIAGSLKNSELMILPGENHDSYVVNSDKIAKIILDFCSK